MRFTDGVLNLFLVTAKWLNQGSQICQNQGFSYSAMLRFRIIDLKFTDVVYCVCYFQQANNQIKESGGRFGKMIIMFVARNDL